MEASVTQGYMATGNVSQTGYAPDGEPVGLPSSNGWLFDYPPGLPLLQNWLNERYPGLSYIVTENGWGNDTATYEQDVNDMVKWIVSKHLL